MYYIKDLWQILTDEIEDEEFLNFAIEHLEELSSYIINGNLNIRIHRDITGEMWFGVDLLLTSLSVQAFVTRLVLFYGI